MVDLMSCQRAEKLGRLPSVPKLPQGSQKLGREGAIAALKTQIPNYIPLYEETLH